MMASPPTSYGSSWSPPPIVLQLICGNRGAWRIAVSAAWEIHSAAWLAASPPHCAAAHCAWREAALVARTDQPCRMEAGRRLCIG